MSRAGVDDERRVSVYIFSKRESGRASKKIGVGIWDQGESKLIVTAVEDRDAQTRLLHSPQEVILADAQGALEVLAVGFWQITEGFSTGPFWETIDLFRETVD